MRTTFIQALIDTARTDERIYLLVGDLGFSMVEPFAQAFPKRFLNMGVAEQNMVGVATGLALSGKIVFIYSIANFPTLRCLEQIRNDICYHNASVNIVSGGTGLCYGALGTTHHSTEDIAVMRSLPNMRVIAPGDPTESALATKAVIKKAGPSYLRLGKSVEPLIHLDNFDFQIGKAVEIHGGTDITLITSGGILYNAIKASEILEGDGVSVRLFSMHTLKPLDVETILKAARETSAIITIEEHSIIGGLGSAVAEVLAEAGSRNSTFKRIGIRDTFCSQVGSQQYLQEQHSLSAEGIANTVRSTVIHNKRKVKATSVI
jgi:transketolase